MYYLTTCVPNVLSFISQVILAVDLHTVRSGKPLKIHMKTMVSFTAAEVQGYKTMRDHGNDSSLF